MGLIIASTADRGHVGSSAVYVENLKSIASTTSVVRYPRMQMLFFCSACNDGANLLSRKKQETFEYALFECAKIQFGDYRW